MKKENKFNAIKSWLTRVGVIGAIAAMSFGASCKKPEEPTPPTPEPEPTPVIPTKEITIDWNWETGIWEQLNKDTIAFYAKQEDVKFVFLNIVNEDNGAASSNFKAKSFHRAVDTLQTRFDISDKVCGSGTIFVNEDFGAQLPDSVPGTRIGMYDKDSAKLAGWGYFIKRCNPFENSK